MAKKSTKKATKKAKMGRPPKQGSKMTDRLMVAVEPERKGRYVEAAQAVGMEISQWIRLHLDRAASEALGE
jgi:hypothetical protein